MQYFFSNLLELIGKECKSPELVTAAKKQLEWILPLYETQIKEL